MYKASHKFFNDCDIAILSAAVADFTPKTVASQKIKKGKDCLTLELTKTKDILTSLSKIKKRQFLVGFALETQNELENAKTKLKKKNLDLIVLNSLNDQGAGFKINTNKITLISKDNKIIPYEVKSKKEVAFDILKYIIREIHV
jgi:phosphopantothenoylcysteine decarboxylase/phosphopantothenate--cysteine ligase